MAICQLLVNPIQTLPMSLTVRTKHPDHQTTNFQQKLLLTSTCILCPYFKGAKPDAQPRPQKKTRPFGMSYLIDESPPWYICILLGFQVRGVNVVQIIP